LIGASLLRKEDARFLNGHGKFIADLQIPGSRRAFLRSQVANGCVRQIVKPEENAANVFTLADLGRLKIRSRTGAAAAQAQSLSPLADDRVRYVGQPIAACMQRSRALAEDLADRVTADLEQLPAVVDVVAAMQPDSVRIFDHWADNAYISSTVVEGDPQTLASAPVRLRRRFRMNRQATVSLECRGVLAYWDHRLNELVVYLSTQGGQVKRLGLSQILGLPENQVRVIAPDIGGGFGGKNRLMPEDVAVAAIAMKVGHPVRWIEDRREHLMASVHARDHYYDLTSAEERHFAGRRGEIYIDASAYALWPTGAFRKQHGIPQSDWPYRIRH
jgi:carbon-monoxide dehydrogenase large subunit